MSPPKITPKIPPPCWDLFEAIPRKMEPGDVEIQFVGSARHENPYGQIQGGLLAAMIDNCIGPAVYLVAPDRQSTTIEMKVTYLAPALPGETLIGRAEVLKHGRTAAFVEVALRKDDAEGTLVAKASATNVFLGTVPVPKGMDEFKEQHGL